MNLTELEQKLLAAARTSAPADAVPYAFEKRIMARLTGRAPLDVAQLWGQALWRAAVSCMAFTLVASVCLIWVERQVGSGEVGEELEDAVYAMSGSMDEAQ